MKITLKRISTGNKFVFPTMPDESLDVDTSNKYQKYDILNKGELAFPAGPNADEISWSGRFFGKPRKGTSLIQNWKSPAKCITTLTTWKNKRVPLNLVVSGAGINIDVTISDFKYSPTGGYGDYMYTIKFIAYGDMKITDGSKKNNKKSSRNSKPKKKVYTVPKNYSSKTGICKISKKYYGTTSKWQKIYKKNKKVIEAAAKKHGKKSSDQGKYLYKGTKLTIP